MIERVPPPALKAAIPHPWRWHRPAWLGDGPAIEDAFYAAFDYPFPWSRTPPVQVAFLQRTGAVWAWQVMLNGVTYGPFEDALDEIPEKLARVLSGNAKAARTDADVQDAAAAALSQHVATR